MRMPLRGCVNPHCILLAASSPQMVCSASMTWNGFPLQKYLERIGLSLPPGADEQGLQRLHSCQAFSIPFENLDIHLGRSISLEPPDLAAKILERNRGGYCFELNGIFLLALEALEFTARPCAARVLYRPEGPGPRTHEAIIVTIDGRNWLADVGFGGPGLRLPLRMVQDQIQEQYGERYRLKRDRDFGIVLQKESGNEFLNLYAFNDSELTLAVDLEMANHYTSTWPSSVFRLHRMCSLARPWGRVTLSDMELTTYRDGQSVSRTLPAGPAYVAAISEHFGIDLDAKYEEFIPLETSGARTA